MPNTGSESVSSAAPSALSSQYTDTNTFKSDLRSRLKTSLKGDTSVKIPLLGPGYSKEAQVQSQTTVDRLLDPKTPADLDNVVNAILELDDLHQYREDIDRISHTDYSHRSSAMSDALHKYEDFDPFEGFTDRMSEKVWTSEELDKLCDFKFAQTVLDILACSDGATHDVRSDKLNELLLATYKSVKTGQVETIKESMKLARREINRSFIPPILAKTHETRPSHQVSEQNTSNEALPLSPGDWQTLQLLQEAATNYTFPDSTNTPTKIFSRICAENPTTAALHVQKAQDLA